VEYLLRYSYVDSATLDDLETTTLSTTQDRRNHRLCNRRPVCP